MILDVGPDGIRQIEKWLPRSEESTARERLRQLAADRDNAWRAHDTERQARQDAETALREVLRPCCSCNYMMRSPHPVAMCGDCREYGPPAIRYPAAAGSGDGQETTR